ncbi:MAG: biopolymer transporter ExbD [Rikenellaceae bacterium]
MAKRSAPEINAGSMADIAFLLLIFYLVTTTMNVDSGIMRSLPPMADKSQKQEDVKMKKRNLLFVSINSQDKILLNLTDQVGIENLTERVKEFILNPNNDPEMPEKNEVEVNLLGKIQVSKAVISLQNTRYTSYNMYIKVQNELTRAYNELRNDLSQREFGKTYDNLDENQQTAIRDAIPLRISEAEPKM